MKRIFSIVPILLAIVASACAAAPAPAPVPPPTPTPIFRGVVGTEIVRQGQDFYVESSTGTQYQYQLTAGLDGVQLKTSSGVSVLDALSLARGVSFNTPDRWPAFWIGPLYYVIDQRSWFAQITPSPGRNVFVEDMVFEAPKASDVIKGVENIQIDVNASAILASLGKHASCIDGLDVTTFWNKGRLPVTGGLVVLTVPTPVIAKNTNIAIVGSHDYLDQGWGLGMSETLFQFSGDFTRYGGSGKVIDQFEMTASQDLKEVCVK